MKTPIIILTKDNPEYLYVTLKSLTATNIGDNPIIIVDDSSSMEKTRSFLYTNDAIEIKFDDWTIKDNLSTQELADKEAATSYLNIPQITKIIGIKKKFTIIRTPKYLGPIYRTLYGINLAFTLYPSAENCVILEDDILFNKNWMTKMFEIQKFEFFKKKAAMISTYTEKLKTVEQPYFKDEPIKGKAVMITNAFYKKLKQLGLLSSMDLVGEGGVFIHLQVLAEKLNFVCLTSRSSYIQNLQKRNLVNKDKVLKYDKNFVMPIAWNENF